MPAMMKGVRTHSAPHGRATQYYTGAFNVIAGRCIKPQ